MALSFAKSSPAVCASVPPASRRPSGRSRRSATPCVIRRQAVASRIRAPRYDPPMWINPPRQQSCREPVGSSVRAGYSSSPSLVRRLLPASSGHWRATEEGEKENHRCTAADRRVHHYSLDRVPCAPATGLTTPYPADLLWFAVVAPRSR